MKVFHLQWVFLIPLQYEGDAGFLLAARQEHPTAPNNVGYMYEERLIASSCSDTVFDVRFLEEQPGCHKTEKKAYKTT